MGKGGLSCFVSAISLREDVISFVRLARFPCRRAGRGIFLAHVDDSR